jgi:hypothetical protein
MKLEKLSSLIEALSSVAVVITLIVLIVEIRQNTEALNAQSRQSVLTSAQTQLLLIANQPNIVTSISKPGALTADENAALDAWLTASMRGREYAWLQYRNGLIDEDQWKTEKAVTGIVVSAPRTRLWWTKLGRTYVSDEFARFVDDLVKNLPVSDKWVSSTDWSNP